MNLDSTLVTKKIWSYFKHGESQTYGKGEWICGSDEGPCDNLHFIHYGLVRAYSDTENEKVHMIFDGGEMFPLLLLADDQNEKVKYDALSKTKIYSVPCKTICEKMQTDTELCNSILLLTLRFYKIQTDRIDNLENRKAYDRVVYRLLTLGDRFGVKKSEHKVVM